MKDTWCSCCNVWIAPYAPDKVTLGDETYHSACLNKKLQQLVPYQVRVQPEPQQLTIFVQ